MLTITGLPAFEDNYIWALGRQDATMVAVVDPGDANVVLDYLRHYNLSLCAILITHHHRDHTGGVRALLQYYPVPVYGPALEDIPAVSHRLRQDDRIKLPELAAEFQIIDAPGHTLGHIMYYGHGSLFCGDTLFAGGCGRLFEGSPAQMQQALAKIRSLPDDTQIFCAHEYTEANLDFALIAEPDNMELHQRREDVKQLRRFGKATVPSRLILEKHTNPFLRWDVPGLVNAAEKFAGKPLTTPADVFGAIRHWKDTLD